MTDGSHKTYFHAGRGFYRIFVETRPHPSSTQQPGAGTVGDSLLNSLYCFTDHACQKQHFVSETLKTTSRSDKRNEWDRLTISSVSFLWSAEVAGVREQTNERQIVKAALLITSAFLDPGLTLLVQIGNSIDIKHLGPEILLSSNRSLNHFLPPLSALLFLLILFNWKAELVQGVISKILSWLVSDIRVLCWQAWKRKIAVLCEELLELD